MSVILLPEISELDQNSLCYAIYSQLYQNFFNAQDKKTPENPNGIVEGDSVSIRLKNTAYNFADAISTSVGGGSGDTGGVLLNYIKKTGGDMTGLFRSNNGFEAGIDNASVIQVYKNESDIGVSINGNLKLGGDSLFLNNKRVISYSSESLATTIDGDTLLIVSPVIKASGELVFGDNRETGVLISPTLLKIGGHNVYHEGNSNLDTVNWKALDMSVSGSLSVINSATFSGGISSLYGATLGYGGEQVLSITNKQAFLSGFLSFGAGYGIKIDNKPVFIKSGENNIQIGSVGGSLFLGNESTADIKLFSDLKDIDGDVTLITKYGGAYFPDSFRVAHKYGADLMATSSNGMVMYGKILLNSANGPSIYGSGDSVGMSLIATRNVGGVDVKSTQQTIFKLQPSTSLYKPQNRDSDTVNVTTTADIFLFDKPIESKVSIGIDNSLTRLTNNALFFTNESYLQHSNGGIKISGNTSFMGSLSSTEFASGFAGYGWNISKSQITGNHVATFDELVIRKKMRVYELEVQKNNITNGALWVSDYCAGDTVIRL